MKFHIQVARYALGKITNGELPGKALIAIQDGLYAPSLSILAGMGPSDNAFEIEQYFKLALGELNMEIPDKYSAAVQLARHYTHTILYGKTNVLEGIANILGECEFLGSEEAEISDRSFFTDLHSLFHSYEELLELDIPSNEIDMKMSEISDQLVYIIMKWRDRTDQEQ